MMDQYITLGDLLKIGSFLLDLTSVILYIYFRQYRTKSVWRLCKQIAYKAVRRALCGIAHELSDEFRGTIKKSV